MPENRDFGSAVTVRLGIVAGGIIGALAGYWIDTKSAPVGEEMRAWPVVVGAALGLGVAWPVLAWFSQRHRGAGIILGAVLTLAAAVALLVRFVWQRGV